MRVKVWALAAAASFVWAAAAAAQARTVSPDQRALKSGVTAYLADHGDLCVGKFTWPRDVSADDQRSGTNDAIQMPVLERLGLVESTEVPAESGATIRRYSLTSKGQQFYRRKKTTTLGEHEQLVEHEGDFCVAHLTLDKVVKWSPPEESHGHMETVVAYTYRIKPAGWMADAEAQKVFPVVDRIMRGAGKMQMNATLRLQDGRWVPVLPGQ